MEVIIEQRVEYLFVRVSGEYDEQRLIRLIKELGEYCMHESCEQVLADFRAHTGAEKASTMELYGFGDMASKAFPPGCRVAVLVRPERLNRDKFTETVARNHGSNFHIFTEKTGAELWLRVFSNHLGQDSN